MLSVSCALLRNKTGSKDSASEWTPKGEACVLKKTRTINYTFSNILYTSVPKDDFKKVRLDGQGKHKINIVINPSQQFLPRVMFLDWQSFKQAAPSIW